MNVVAWLVEGTWPAAVDAVRGLPATEVTLLHVIDSAVAGSAHGAFAGLLGRGGGRSDPGAAIERAEVAAEDELLAAAAERLGGPATARSLRGRTEREVVAACEGADVLVVVRDGDLSRVGPKSLGPATRFVVDHAACAVLLVWPRPPDHAEPPPPPPPHHGPPHHGPPHHGPPHHSPPGHH